MHLYFMSRGVKHQRDIFVTTMQSQFFQRKRINVETGEEELDMVQGALRPVELWEYVFPEESLPQVLSMLNYKEDDYALSKSKMAMLRKMIRCGKIPKLPETPKENIIAMNGIGVHCIGIKKDITREMIDENHGHAHIQEVL